MVDLCQSYYYDDEQVAEFKTHVMELLLKYEKSLMELEEKNNEN
jgi:hypothetical protein